MKISNFALFRNLPEKEVEKLAEYARIFQFQQGCTIIPKDSNIDFVYFIRSGRVKELTYTQTGKEVVFNTLSMGDCFGLVSPFSSETSKSEFIACTDCEVYAIRVTRFFCLMGANSTFTQSVLGEFPGVPATLSEKSVEKKRDSINIGKRQDTGAEMV